MEEIDDGRARGGARQSFGHGGGAPAALSGEEEVYKLHGTMGKLFLGLIGAEKDRRWALHCELGGGGGNGGWRRLWARKQGLGPALGGVEQVRGEARWPRA